MLKIEKFVTPSPEQWEITIEGMRNAMNSWDKMDSHVYPEDCQFDATFVLGENDKGLAMRLNNGGAPHAKYRRMLPVHVTVTAPLYWWKEFETYRVGVASNPSDIEFNSCSTMHKIHAKEFELNDFSHEHLFGDRNEEICSRNSGFYFESRPPINDDLVYCTFISPVIGLEHVIKLLNVNRKEFLDTKDKKYWYNMIQLLPSSYNQKRTIYLNYQVLYEIYEWRRNHKLDEWHTFCHWIEELPYSELIIGEKE